MTKISISPYSDADFATVTFLWFDSAQSIGLPMPVSLDDLRTRWPKELAAGWIVHVARDDTETVGFLAFKDDHLEQLFVAPDRQGEGIGKKLLAFAKRQMPGGFHLTTAVLGRATRFYEREGLERGEISLHRFGHEVVRYDWRAPQP